MTLNDARAFLDSPKIFYIVFFIFCVDKYTSYLFTIFFFFSIWPGKGCIFWYQLALLRLQVCYFLIVDVIIFQNGSSLPSTLEKKKRFNTAFWTGKKKSGFVFPLLHLLSLSSLTHIFFFIYLQLKVKGMLLSHVQASSLSFV